MRNFFTYFDRKNYAARGLKKYPEFNKNKTDLLDKTYFLKKIKMIHNENGHAFYA